MQSYYFIPLPGYSVNILKRNVLKAYSTAHAIIQQGIKLQKEHGLLSFAPHFVTRSLLAAACVTVSVLLSTYMKDVALEERDTAVRDGVSLFPPGMLVLTYRTPR